MEAQLFGILKLTPGRYSPSEIIDSHRQVRREIMRNNTPDRQRRLDDALIACILLQDPKRQAEMLDRVNRDAVLNAKATEREVRRVSRQHSGSQQVSREAAATDKRYISTARQSNNVRRLINVAPPKRRSEPAAAPSTDKADTTAERFANIVADYVEDGILRMSARRKLLTKAAAMGIESFKANLIIAEALHDLSDGWRPPAANDKNETTSAGKYIPVNKPRYGLRITLAIIAAAIVDVIVIAWLYR